MSYTNVLTIFASGACGLRTNNADLQPKQPIWRRLCHCHFLEAALATVSQ